jgi:ubiquinone/menaquinone biosynthesis C-methylase UbiE
MNKFVFNFMDVVKDEFKLKEPMLEIGSKLYEGDVVTNIKMLFPDKRCTGLDIEKGKGVDIQGDAHYLPFEDQSFNTVFLLETIEHLWYPQVAVREIARVLKPRGLFVVTIPWVSNQAINRDENRRVVGIVYPIHHKNDWWRFTDWAIERLLRDNNFKKKIFAPTVGRAYVVAEKREKPYRQKRYKGMMW